MKINNSPNNPLLMFLSEYGLRIEQPSLNLVEKTQKEVVQRLGEAIETRSAEGRNHVRRVADIRGLARLRHARTGCPNLHILLPYMMLERLLSQMPSSINRDA